MCKYIAGNMCILGAQCHCHPVRHQPSGYNDGYFEQDDSKLYDPESDSHKGKLTCLDTIV